VKSQVTTIHEIHNDVTDIGQPARSARVGLSLYSHVFNVLETVSQITQKGVVQVLEHPSFTYDISDTFRSHH
jgi:hypothetical protein